MNISSFSLIHHVDFPPSAPIEEVRFEINQDRTTTESGEIALSLHLWVIIDVDPALIRLGGDGARNRRNGLWKTTCFEVFLRPRGHLAYSEWNLSPSSDWAAYDFSGPRVGMADRAVEIAPFIDQYELIDWRVEFSIAPLIVPTLDAGYDLNLAAVIEETNGTKSYWALAHPDGPPDFHDPACFVAHLPAIATS